MLSRSIPENFSIQDLNTLIEQRYIFYDNLGISNKFIVRTI